MKNVKKIALSVLVFTAILTFSPGQSRSQSPVNQTTTKTSATGTSTSTYSKGVITGLFDAGWNSFSRNREQWEREMQNLKDLGCDTIVLQYSIEEPTHTYYPSSLGWVVQHAEQTNCIPFALEAATKKNMNVWIALYYEGAKWWGTPDTLYLQKQKERCIEVFRELEKLYGKNPCVAGYYLPHEIARYYWQKPEDLQRLLSEFLVPLTNTIHRESSKKFIASPFFNQNLETPEQLKVFWQDLMKEWSPDVVVPQDGIGVGHATLENVGSYLQAMVEGVSPKADLWVNVELFTGRGSSPAPFSRIQAQIASAAPYAKKIIAYDYSVITRNATSEEMNQLFDELKLYKDTVLDNGSQRK
jgi:hypothetical protein